MSLETLGKHKLLYCRSKSGNCTPLSDILSRLLEQEKDVAVSQPLDDFLDSAGLTEPVLEPVSTVESTGQATDVKSVEQPCVVSCFDEVVSLWISQLTALEGQIREGSYDGAYGVINRMLEDGLISSMEHGNLLYTTRLFTRLHSIYQLGMLQECKGEYVDILVTLYDMKKINRAAFTYLLLNV